MTELVYHCSLVSDWETAKAAGAFTISTRGRSLAEEGFIHAAYADQVEAVLARYYGDVTEPMVLLCIDPDLLTVPLVPESPPGAQEEFPHLYGPLNLDAVIDVAVLQRAENGWITPGFGR